MNIDERTRTITSTLETIDSKRQLAFGVCVLERAIPAYLEFTAESGHVGVGQLLAGLASCWRYLEGGPSDGLDFISADDCESIMPDSEEYGSTHTSAAIDAVDIACNLLDFMKDPATQFIVKAVTAQLDTIDLFVQALEHKYGLSENDQLMKGSDSLMGKELDRMDADLFFLASENAEGTTLTARLTRHILDRNYRSLKIIFMPSEA